MGEILACPKCGGMVLVTLPESDAPPAGKNQDREPSAGPGDKKAEEKRSDHIAAPPRPAAETPYDSTEVVVTDSAAGAAPPAQAEKKTGGSFHFPDSIVVPAASGDKSDDSYDSDWSETVDDIEPPAVAPPEGETTPPTEAETPPEAETMPPPAQRESSLTPNLRRILMMAGMGVFGAVLAIGLLAFVASRNPPEEAPVAVSGPPVAVSSSKANAEASTDASPTNEANNTGNDPPQAAGDSEPPTVAEPPTEQRTSSDEANQTHSKSASGDAPATPPVANSGTTSNPAPAAPPPVAGASSPPLGNPEETKALRQLDDLLDFLDTEAPPPNVPSAPAPAGETPPLESGGRLLPPPVDVEAMLGITIKQIDFPDTPLLVFLEFIQELTTAPITVDARVLAVAGVRPTTPVQVKLADVTVGEALHAALEPLTLAYVVQEENILITPWRESQQQQAHDNQTYDVAALVGEDAASRNEFVARIKRLLHPGSWSDEGVQIKIDDHQLVVAHTETVQWEVGKLLEQIRGVRTNSGKPALGWAEAAQRGRERLAKPLRLNYSQPVLLTTILARLREISGAQFLVDWQSLYALGLTPEIEASFLADNQPLDQKLTEMLAPLALAYRVADEEIVEIAAPETLSLKLRVEAYPAPGLKGDATQLQAFQEKLAKFRERLPQELLDRTSAFEIDRPNGCVWTCLNDAQHAEFMAEFMPHVRLPCILLCGALDFPLYGHAAEPAVNAFAPFNVLEFGIRFKALGQWTDQLRDTDLFAVLGDADFRRADDKLERRGTFGPAGGRPEVTGHRDPIDGTVRLPLVRSEEGKYFLVPFIGRFRRRCDEQVRAAWNQAGYTLSPPVTDRMVAVFDLIGMGDLIRKFRVFEHPTRERPLVAVGVVTPHLAPRPDTDKYVAAIDRGRLRFARTARNAWQYRRPACQVGELLAIVLKQTACRVLPQE